jgi:hypothetical protein
MLVESLMLAGVAGGAGVAIGWATSRLLMGLKPANLPVAIDIRMDWRVLLFTAAISVATGLAFGLAPALRASVVEAARVLREESQTAGRKKARMRNALVVAQMAMCVVLLTGATLCVRSLRNANAIDPGFNTRHITMADLDPGRLGYAPEKVKEPSIPRRLSRLAAISARRRDWASCTHADWRISVGLSRSARSNTVREFAILPSRTALAIVAEAVSLSALPYCPRRSRTFPFTCPCTRARKRPCSERKLTPTFTSSANGRRI